MSVASLTNWYASTGTRWPGELHRTTVDELGNADAEFATRRGARRALQRQPPGSVVIVWYDPNSPEQSTLDPGWPGDMLGSNFVLLSFLSIVLIVGGLISMN